MRQFSSLRALGTGAAFVLVFALTAYGAQFALGDGETQREQVSRATSAVAPEARNSPTTFVAFRSPASRASLNSRGETAAPTTIPAHTTFDAPISSGSASFSPVSSAELELPDEDGAEIYMTRCMSCHQMNGRGVSGVFPPLAGAEWVTGDKGRLIRVVLQGLTGEITVADEKYSGAMPPWKSFLNDQQTAALLTYIRSHWGNEASEVTADEVSKVRAATEERRDPWTEEELSLEKNQGIPGEKGGESTSVGSDSTNSDGEDDGDSDKGSPEDVR